MTPDDRPPLFLLHVPGGGTASRTAVADRLARFRCVGVDLPGNGDAASLADRTLDEMADHVARAVRAEAPRRWALVGRGLGAKVAVVLARRAEDGAPGLEGLAGVILLGLDVEKPDEVARLIEEHLTTDIPASYRALLDTPRVSTRTRDVLLERGAPDRPDPPPATMGTEQFDTLRAVVERVVPLPPDASIDLAMRIDRELASGAGDGWRFALLPADDAAFRLALDTADAASRAGHGAAFARLDPAARDALLRRTADGDLADGPLTGVQMKLWFEDLRAAAARAYMAHPATLARIGYSGIANGGDAGLGGFGKVGLGEREAWEPMAAGQAS